MKIDNLVRIIDGTLQTEPSIDAFERITFDASRVLRGDLFIDSNASLQACAEASSKGAYAIVSTLDFQGEDHELAWICVDTIEQALIKLLRYHVAEKTLQCVCLSPLQASLLEMLQSPKSIKILKGTLIETAIELLRGREKDFFGIIDSALCQNIAPTAQCIQTANEVKVTQKGLFLSSFWYQNHCWLDQKIPSLFVPDLIAVANFCESNGLSYALENLSWSEHFYPQFVTPSLRKKEFGCSDKVLIFEPTIELLEQEIAYLEEKCDASQWVLCLPNTCEKTFTCNAPILYYTQSEDIHMLKEKNILYALILGCKEDFEPLLNQSFIQQPTLF